MLDRVLRAGTILLVLLLGGPPLVRADGWPEHGPRKEGMTLAFPHHNLRWALPNDERSSWQDPTTDEARPTGRVVSAVRVSADGTGRTAVTLTALDPLKTTWFREWMQRTDPTDISRQVLDGAPDSTRVLQDLMLGGVPAAAVEVRGTRAGARVTYRIYAVTMPGHAHQYDFELGGTDADRDFDEAAREVISGLEYVEKTCWIPAPACMPGTFTYYGPRGSGYGEEQEIKGPGYRALKPRDMSQVATQAVQNDSLCFTWEGRSESKQHALCLQLASFSVARTPGRQTELERGWLLEREKEWRSRLKDVEVVHKGREALFKVKLGAWKGTGYELRGNMAGVPVVEYGYNLTERKYVFCLRLQYLGADAEREMSRLFATIRKSMKLGI